MKKLLKNKWLVSGLISILAIISVGLISLVGLLDNLEFVVYDLRFEARGVQSTEQTNIALVTIDDQSFVTLKKKWPYPRRYFARAIQNLSAAGAKLIIFDVEFTEPSSIDPQDDDSLANVIANACPVIFAGKIAVEYGNHDVVNKYIIKPLKPLLDAGGFWGYANVDHDADAFIRRYNLFQQLGEQVVFPLSIEALRVLQQLPAEKIRFNDQRSFTIGNFTIPKHEFNTMLINYTGAAQNFPTYSLANVLDDAQFHLSDDEDTDIFELQKSAGIFRDKIIFIGASAEELQDNKFTPFFDYDGKKRKMPGVEMHANALHTIITGSFIRSLPSFYHALIIIILSGLALFFSKKLKPYQGVLGSILALGIFVLLSFYLFASQQIWVKMISPILCFVFTYGFNMVHQVLTEQREKGLYRKTFQQYVARSVVDTMLSSGELPKFGGERKNLTVLFSDIRSFTTFSEKYPPEAVVRHLTEYLSAMVDVIFRHDGTLDKFVGDEIMALYGAPYYFDNHAERACLTALDMVAELRHLQKRWSQKQMEYFQIGIGINTGKVIVGNLGSIQLFDYTVIGDEVNLGARLEGANKHYSTTIIISEKTYNEVQGKAIVRELDVVRVKGKKKPVRIYELRGMYSLPSIEKELLIDIYSYGLELFQKQNWVLSLKQFRRILRYFPTDGPSRVYIQRCLDFIENPPPADWDGIFEFAVK